MKPEPLNSMNFTFNIFLKSFFATSKNYSPETAITTTGLPIMAPPMVCILLGESTESVVVTYDLFSWKFNLKSNR